MSCSINVKDVVYKNEVKTVLHGINLNVGHEEKVAIIGANGSGKSSLLKIIAGLYAPSLGSVHLFHTQMKNLKAFNAFRSDIGYLPQDVSDHFLCPTVIEDVMFALRAKGEKKEEAYTKALDILTQLGISHLQERIIDELSGGEQKIVALAGILITQPRILLLDEPTNALDEEAENRIIDILNGINKSMIIVSHHRSFIQRLTPTIYKLNHEGLILQ
jgi:cobalt/nickel transport system ATP-binding protein